MICAANAAMIYTLSRGDISSLVGLDKKTDLSYKSIFWWIRGEFSGATRLSPRLCSLPTSAKTVHRTVFFRNLRLLLPCSTLQYKQRITDPTQKGRVCCYGGASATNCEHPSNWLFKPSKCSLISSSRMSSITICLSLPLSTIRNLSSHR